MVAMMIVGRLVGKVDTRLLVLTGLGLMAWSLHAMTQFNTRRRHLRRSSTPASSRESGSASSSCRCRAIAFATLAPRYRNEGTAMFSLIRNIGSSVGISLVMTVLGHEVQSSHAALSESITPFRDALQVPGVPPLWNWSTELGRVALNAEVSRQALTIAYLNDFRFMMYLSLLARAVAVTATSARVPCDNRY